MAREYVPIFFDWLENTQDLSAEEKGHLIDAVIMYASGSDEWMDVLESSGEKIAFRFMRGQVDRNNEIAKKRSAAGSSKDDQNESNNNKPEQNGTNEIKTEQTETNSPKEKDKEKENNKEKDNDKEIKKESRRFAPPSVEEVAAYCQSRNNGISAQAFVDFYASKGWKIGKEKMQDWKAAVRTWENKRKESTQTAQVKKVVAQDYSQRDYSDVQSTLEEMQRRRFAERLAVQRNE